jgi:methylglutaconyl-CoA hydratase
MSIKTEMAGPVLVVTLDRPEQRNALDAATAGTLRDLFERIAFLPPAPPRPWPEAAAPCRPRVIILRGTGPAFCAGADLKEMERMARADQDENLIGARALAGTFRAIRLCPVPVVARVHGAAYGGGVGLAAACDIVVASSAARFQFTEARLGLVAAVIAPVVLGRIGEAACRHWFLTGDVIDADTALRIGLADRLAGADELDDAVTRVVRSLLAGGAAAHARIKQMLEGLLALGFEKSLDFTARLLADTRAGEEAQVAIGAFFRKEPAPWTAGAAAWTLPSEEA